MTLVLLCHATTALAITTDESKSLFLKVQGGEPLQASRELRKHPLYPYFQYYSLKAELPEVDSGWVTQFIAAYKDTPLSGWMLNSAISKYAGVGRWDEVLAVAADRVPSNIESRCYYYRALWEKRQKISYSEGKKLWLTGSSRPAACDPYFDLLEEVGFIDPELVWERLLLSLQSGQKGVAKFLLNKLDKTEWSNLSYEVRRLLKEPAELLNLPPYQQLSSNQMKELVYSLSLDITRNETDSLLEIWPVVKNKYGLAKDQVEKVERSFARYSYKLDDENSVSQKIYRNILIKYGDADLIEPALRKAIAESNWGEVIYWTEKVKSDDYYSAYNQYWRGRALQRIGLELQAKQAFKQAAEQRNFYGFLAADYLSIPYQLNQTSPQVTAQELSQLDEVDTMQRIRALLDIDQHRLALAEWNYYLRRVPQQSALLTEYAYQQQWFGLTVAATISGKHWDFVGHRFPLAFRREFINWGKVRGVDANVLMAVARRESAFNPEAISPVGARGLMQVMPATGKYVAKKLNILDPGAEGLSVKETNIQLASAYLKELLDRYDGSLVLALAGYNAGPHKADKWIENTAMDFDQFIESIPYRETRSYVKAVLAYRVIFDLRAGKQDLSVLRPNERAYPSAFASFDLYDDANPEQVCKASTSVC